MPPGSTTQDPSRERKVLVVPYDPAWPRIFEQIRASIWGAVQDIALGIEHVGSTAICGLAAKPIIDIDVVVSARTDMPAVIDRLDAIGYRHEGALGIEEREAFSSPPGLPMHHLYACVQNSLALENHLTVCDYLRRHPSSAAAYGELKQELAERYASDPKGYGTAKTDFLLTLLGAAGWPRALLQTIRRANS